MKTALAILLSFIMMEAPVLAIHGGYTLGGTQSLIGTYAGVLIPTSDTLVSGTSTTFGSNDLGLFTLNVPDTGPATGLVAIFSGGRTFFGDMEGLPDPSSASGINGIPDIRGVISATYNYTLYVQSTVTTGTSVQTSPSGISITTSAKGTFTATVSNEASVTAASPTGVNLTGEADLDINQGFVNDDGAPAITEEVDFALDGFQQSTTPTTDQTTLTDPTTTSGT